LALKENFRKGTIEFEMAQQLKQLQISGSFVSNLSYANGHEKLHFIAWFSGDPWYCHTLNQFSTQQILQDAKRYHVKYYFYFYEGAGDDYQLKDDNGTAYQELTQGVIPGMKVFDLDF